MKATQETTVALTRWCEAVLADTAVALADGRVARVTRPHVRVTRRRGPEGETRSHEPVGVELLEFKDMFHFLNAFRPRDEFKRASNQLADVYRIELDLAQRRLLSLGRRIATDAVKQGDERSGLVEHAVAMLLSDLEEAPKSWQWTGWMRGMTIESGRSISLGNTIFRAATGDEGNIVRPVEQKSAREDVPLPSMIASIVGGESPTEAFALVRALRLWRLSSVKIYYAEVVGSGDINGADGGTENHGVGEAWAGDGHIAGADVEAVTSFLRETVDALSRRREDAFSIAVGHYERALFEGGEVEDVVTCLSSCMEACLMKSTERTELTGRLAQRSAMLARRFGFRPTEVARLVTSAYDVRSTYVHGSRVTKEQREQMTKALPELCDIARLVLVTLLHLGAEKDPLLSKVDNALIDDDAREKLSRLLHASPALNLTARTKTLKDKKN